MLRADQADIAEINVLIIMEIVITNVKTIIHTPEEIPNFLKHL